MDRVTIGIIGVGGYGRTHLRAIRQAEEKGMARLVAAVILPGLEPETERELETQGVLVYRSHQEMLERAPREAPGGMQLVGVPCGIDQHAPLSIAALEAGYHVLCEKPAAGNIAEALEMQRVALRAGKILAIGYQHLFSRTIQRIKELSLEGRRGGRLGRLLKAKSWALWPRDSRYYGRNAWAGRLAVEGRPIYDSPIQNATAHYFQNLLYVAGAEKEQSATPVRLYGENYRAKDIESADTQFVRVWTREGALISFMVSHATTVYQEPVAEYVYERGLIRWRDDRGRGTTDVYLADAAGAIGSSPVETVDNGGGEVHDLAYLGVIQAIREGRQPAATIHNCIQHTACVDALFSRGELYEIPREHTQTDTTDAIVTHIPGIADLVRTMYDREISYYEAGAPWGRPGKVVDL